MSPDALTGTGLIDNSASTEADDSLPASWGVAPLGSLGRWIGGGTPSKSVSSYWEGGSIPWVSPKDMKSTIIVDTQDHITEAAVAGSATNFVPPNSVLMVMRSGILRHTFPVAVNATRVTVNQDLRALVPADGIDPRYLAHYLRSIERELLHECSKDGTTVQSIEASALAGISIPIAPTAEQRRIVARIEELFTEIADGEAALERARRDLDTWRRAVLKAAVTGELTRDWREANHPTETGDELMARLAARGPRSAARGRWSVAVEPVDTNSPPRLAEGWVWARLSDLIVAGPTNGYSPKRSKDGSGSLALKLTATTRGVIDLSPNAVKRLSEVVPRGSDLYLKPGDLLFQRGNTIEYVGISAIYDGPTEAYIFPDLMIRVRTGDRVIAEWVWRFANSDFGRRYMQDNATGTAGTMPKINGEILRNLVIPLPPRSEIVEALRLIAEGLSIIGDLDEATRAAQTANAALRRSILKAAFGGRLVPQDAADEPASALLARLRNRPAAPSARRGLARRRNQSPYPSLPALASD